LRAACEYRDPVPALLAEQVQQHREPAVDAVDVEGPDLCRVGRTAAVRPFGGSLFIVKLSGQMPVSRSFQPIGAAIGKPGRARGE
jgi:hypothetical protein